jgi:uncharacterized protein (TIGR03083 family)
MTLPRDDVSDGLVTELDSFERLVRTLDDTEWAKPSRCDGWTVAGVASHVVGTMADVAAGRLDGLGTPEVTEREVAERAGRSPAQLADECAEVREASKGLLGVFDDDAWAATAPGGYEGSLGDGVEALWYDTFLHADDIRDAIGRPTEITDGLRASLSHLAFELTKRGWGPATLAFDGLPRFDISGGGADITGDAFEFVLAATGRIDPAKLGYDETVNVYRA